MRRAIPALLIVACVACGTAPTAAPGEDLPMVTTTVAAETGQEALVALEAGWMCDVQRYAFDELSDLDAELDARLDAAGATRAEYETFKAGLSGDDSTRAAVADRYGKACGGARSDPDAPEQTAETPATTTTVAAADLSNPLVALEGKWMCDIQRFAYTDLSALDAELTSRIEDAGLTKGEYEAFKAELAADEALRDDVVAAYRWFCDTED